MREYSDLCCIGGNGFDANRFGTHATGVEQLTQMDSFNI